MANKHKLSFAFIRSASAGKYSDGAGLWLHKRDDGGSQWFLRISIGGKRREMGLGGYPEISIKQAREDAETFRSAAHNGIDPIQHRDQQKRELLNSNNTLEKISYEAFEARKAELKEELPKVLVAILAKEKEEELPLYLDCIQNLNYSKSRIFIYIRTNNNTDQTETILNQWVAKNKHLYAGIEFDAEPVEQKVELYKPHEWNRERFKVLSKIREESLVKAIEQNCDFYFTSDVDNFIIPQTLCDLVNLNLPIVAPLLKTMVPGARYSNFHEKISSDGYFKDSQNYNIILNQILVGIIEVPVVHCTYLIRSDLIPKLTYSDSSNRHEYVIFSNSARKEKIPQYIDNRKLYGYIYFSDGALNHPSANLEKVQQGIKKMSSKDTQNNINNPTFNIHKSLSGSAQGADLKSSIPLVVASHERSGTHCLMNTIALCTDYNSQCWDFDPQSMGDLIDFNSGDSLREFFTGLEKNKYDSKRIVKSHFGAVKMEDTLASNTKIIYIYRDPISVFISFWKFLSHFQDHGTVTVSPAELCLAKPSGWSTIYNDQFYENYFDRWLYHVAGWLKLAETSRNVTCISYAELLRNTKQTLVYSLDELSIPYNKIPILAEKNHIHGKNMTLSCQERENVQALINEKLETQSLIKAEGEHFLLNY